MRTPQKASRPAVAVLLSALLPGLGQFYNGQWGKGLGCLTGHLVVGGILSSSVDLDSLQRSADSGVPPQHIGRISFLLLLLFIIAIWSVVDAGRSAKRDAM